MEVSILSARGSGNGMFSMRSERGMDGRDGELGVEVMVDDRITMLVRGCELIVWMAVGCLL
jgi:hypothetical protein